MNENTDNDIMMGSFKIIFKILNRLDLALDDNNLDLEKTLSADSLKITEVRRNNYLIMLQNAGYIDGLKINEYINDSIDVDVSEVSITLDGLQYLCENSLMIKAANAFKGLSLKVAELSIGLAK